MKLYLDSYCQRTNIYYMVYDEDLIPFTELNQEQIDYFVNNVYNAVLLKDDGRYYGALLVSGKHLTSKPEYDYYIYNKEVLKYNG